MDTSGKVECKEKWSWERKTKIHKPHMPNLIVHSKQRYTYNTHKTIHIQLYIGTIIALLPIKLVSIRYE